MSPIAAIAGTAALSPVELRVLGCLLEKQRTTPDQYPLSLNALRLACNQSTNRDPVVSYDEPTVRDALHRLERRGLVRLASGAGSRAVKYRHLLADALPMDDGERAVMTVLMLRGAQTPGELKQRAERMHAFADLTAVNEALTALIGRELALRLPRRPGQKEERYAQLLDDGGEAVDGGAGSSGEAAGPSAMAGADAGDAAIALGSPLAELAELRERVERLEREVAALRDDRASGEGDRERAGGNGEQMRNPSGGVAFGAPGTDDASSLDPRR
jgi:uncharacterized protein YceH (UPF0502 family)